MVRRLLVNNLDDSTTEAALWKLFAIVGPVERVVMGIDFIDGAKTNVALITMGTTSDAKQAIRLLNDYVLDSRKIKVREARQHRAPR